MINVKPAVILLDTNVWIDFFIGDRPGHAQARDLMNRAFKLAVPLAYAVVSAKDVYYIVCSDFKKDARKRNGGVLDLRYAAAAEATGWACVKQMDEMATAVGADLVDIKVAAHMCGIHRDFGDDLIIAAAKRLGSDCLVTNDEKLLRHCPVAALDVPDMIDVLEQVEKNVEDFFDGRGSIYTTLNEAMS